MVEDYDWLPDLITLADYNGRWEDYVEALYGIFATDFLKGAPTLNGKPIEFRRDGKPYKGKDWAFWYLTCDHPCGYLKEEDWEINLRRCERIAWIRLLIAGYEYGAAGVVGWFQVRRRQERLAIALDDFSYIVILRDTSCEFLLITHFFVAEEHEKRRYEREYLAYKKDQRRP